MACQVEKLTPVQLHGRGYPEFTRSQTASMTTEEDPLLQLALNTADALVVTVKSRHAFRIWNLDAKAQNLITTRFKPSPPFGPKYLASVSVA